MAETNGQQQLSDAERYRRAAEDALQQLDWTIGYIHGIRRWRVSKALARNRTYIRRNLGQADEPLPTEQTRET
jgi:hypothetical protein